MKVIPVCPGSAMANCYLIVHGTHARVVDPCVSVSGIERAAADAGAVIEGILLTHGHFDHVLTLDTLRDALSVPAYIHENDQILLPDGQKNAFALFFGQDRAFRPAERTLQDGDSIPLGDTTLTVLHTPGHTAGSVCYLADGIILTGDTLFADSFGRHDLFSGDVGALKASLRHLGTLDPTLTLYAGHGAPCPLGDACTRVCRILHL